MGWLAGLKRQEAGEGVEDADGVQEVGGARQEVGRVEYCELHEFFLVTCVGRSGAGREVGWALGGGWLDSRRRKGASGRSGTRPSGYWVGPRWVEGRYWGCLRVLQCILGHETAWGGLEGGVLGWG